MTQETEHNGVVAVEAAETSKDAPIRIWATVNGASTRFPDLTRQLIGGWSQDPERPGVVEYVRADLVAEQAQRIAELEAERRWQPIETADKDAPLLLLGVVRNGVLLAAHIGTYCYPGNKDEAPCWWSLQDDAEITPTHWMPLPASPHEGTQS